MSQSSPGPASAPNSQRRILFASLAGTTIEFFDFYIYATAAVLVFPKQFFPSSDATAATLQSLATFAIAFFTRPIGSALFGHFGDRVGRKATLVAALLTMGLSTVAIGLLPPYASIGPLAPLLLCLCRLGQGLGLGGEWGGAVLLATENAPPGRRAWYGMFPQLGAPLGFIASGGIFLLLSKSMSDADFMSYGWRIPFLASSVLVVVGLWVRLKVTETPVFQKAIEREEREAVPMLTVARDHMKPLVLGTMIALAAFVIFYLMTVFALSWGTTKLGFTRERFITLQLISMLFFAAMIPLSALLADRNGRRVTMMLIAVGICLFGLVMGPLFDRGQPGIAAALILGMSFMGLTYGPLGTILSELYPTSVRYTGASLSFNLAGIFGASLAPSIATWLATDYGIAAVGWYLSGAGGVTLLGLFLSRETRNTDYARSDAKIAGAAVGLAVSCATSHRTRDMCRSTEGLRSCGKPMIQAISAISANRGIHFLPRQMSRVR
ncbi:MAG: MFS transporter [Planctomycetota bacterium]|nr:MFS transporter [Planctomycetota bacterium]